MKAKKNLKRLQAYGSHICGNCSFFFSFADYSGLKKMRINTCRRKKDVHIIPLFARRNGKKLFIILVRIACEEGMHVSQLKCIVKRKR